jgi:two-component system, cell cycle sensor histidine kinase and response regulator CckA
MGNDHASPDAEHGVIIIPGDATRRCHPMNDTILVVDDEPSARTAARDALQSVGYVVLDSDDPQQALQIVRQQPVDLLLVDVVMPLMRGTELADRVQAISASTKILLMSGYPTSDIVPSGRPFIAKPFSVDSLAEKIRDVLADRTSKRR